jgi:hypothetical protein
MAELLLRLDPKALDTAFGEDVAAEIDRDLSLPGGTSGRVARALADRLGSTAKPVRRIADRAAQELPTVPLPNYGGWHGPGVLGARIVSAALVRADLAEPAYGTPEEYLARVRGLWA